MGKRKIRDEAGRHGGQRSRPSLASLLDLLHLHPCSETVARCSRLYDAWSTGRPGADTFVGNNVRGDVRTNWTLPIVDMSVGGRRKREPEGIAL